jgi:hypothetical protein
MERQPLRQILAAKQFLLKKVAWPPPTSRADAGERLAIAATEKGHGSGGNL